MNITSLIGNLSKEGSVSNSVCKEWCSGQHFKAAYGQFLILLLFNALMTGMYLILYKGSDNIIHNTKLTEERMVIILNSIIKLVFFVNAGFGIYWMF